MKSLLYYLFSNGYVRLFTFRIIRGKHPFKGDLKHLHHLVDKLTKNKNYTIIDYYQFIDISIY